MGIPAVDLDAPTQALLASVGKPCVVNVRDHGAVGDGKTDDSAAFTAARDMITASRAGYDGNVPQMSVMLIPPGQYLITQPDALVADHHRGGTDFGTGVQLAGDLGNTTVTPQALPTHLTDLLPTTRGGTRATSLAALLQSANDLSDLSSAGAACTNPDGSPRHRNHTARPAAPPAGACRHFHRSDCGGFGHCTCTGADPTPRTALVAPTRVSSRCTSSAWPQRRSGPKRYATWARFLRRDARSRGKCGRNVAC
jgi:hypothetical protein